MGRRLLAGGGLGRASNRHPEPTTLPGRPISLWLDDGDHHGHPPLDRDLEVDVAVIGGGMAGVSVALELQEDGEVALLEARSIASSEAQQHHGEALLLHGLSYASMRDAHGEATTRTYAQLNQSGLARAS